MQSKEKMFFFFLIIFYFQLCQFVESGSFSSYAASDNGYFFCVNVRSVRHVIFAKKKK